MKISKNALFLIGCVFLIASFSILSCSKSSDSEGAPTITSITPSSAKTGQDITITGTNLSASSVTIGGIAALAPTNSPTSIETSIPAGATVGVQEVVVTNIGGTAKSSVTVTGIGDPPVITGVNPSSASIGQEITITGTGLAKAGVFVATKAATILSNTDTSITVTIPGNIALGSAALMVITSLGDTTVTITII